MWFIKEGFVHNSYQPTMLVLGLGPVMDLINKQQKRNQQGCIGKEMEGVAQVYRMERERERNRRRQYVLWTAEKTNGFECAVANGGASGGVQARERHRMRIFFGIREISHCALMGELIHNSDEKASALFEKYNVIYDKISWKVHIPYMETHCSVYLFGKLPAKHDCFADLLMYVTQFFERTGQVIFHPIGACEMNRDVMNQSRLKGFKNFLELTIGCGQKVTKQRTCIAK